ncbi:substrate-binding domain-containing protein [Amnibacterium endophyticum]|uniref:Substrate-binding domain-containing protein n=1 Tax=Amnibacterium endophyticum TaxID=2109337 RepID=A0ABW4LDG7_9MICO
MKTATKRVAMAGAAVLLAIGSLTACSNGASSSGASAGTSGGGASSGTQSGKIGLLLPDNVTYRYAAQDKPLFEAKVKELCPDCTVLYQNAAASASTQQQQAQSMLTQGVKVLVLDAQDGKAAAQIVTLAKQRNVPVISYDRLVDSPDLAAYISFNNEKVGELQATSLVDRMKELNDPAGSGLIMVNGSPTDNNATYFKKGAHSVIDKSDYKVLAEYDTPDWLPAKAQAWATSEASKLGTDKIKGVYAANDDTAAGVITALQTAGVKKLPPVTGQDATLAGIQRILLGTQYMTVYKAPKPEAETAAEYAVDLLQGKKLDLTDTATSASGYKVPAKLFDPVAVTVDKIQSTVIADGTYKVSQVCTSAALKAACSKNGIN